MLFIIYIMSFVYLEVGTKVATSVEPCASAVTSSKSYGNNLQFCLKMNGGSWLAND